MTKGQSGYNVSLLKKIPLAPINLESLYPLNTNTLVF